MTKKTNSQFHIFVGNHIICAVGPKILVVVPLTACPQRTQISQTCPVLRAHLSPIPVHRKLLSSQGPRLVMKGLLLSYWSLRFTGRFTQKSPSKSSSHPGFLLLPQGRISLRLKRLPRASSTQHGHWPRVRCPDRRFGST